MSQRRIEGSGLGFVEVPTLGFVDGLREWANPLTAIQNLVGWGGGAYGPAFTLPFKLGLATPLLLVFLYLTIGVKDDRQPRGRRKR